MIPPVPKSRRRRFTAAGRLLAIAPMLEHNRLYARGYKMRPSLEQIVKGIAAEQGVSRTTIWNWYRRFQKGGYNALANAPRRDAGRSRYLAAHPEIEPMIRARMGHGRSPFFIWRSLGSVLSSDALPSYKVVLRYVRTQKQSRGASAQRVAA